ncbi:MAG: TasA family protein [Actinomycetota bacterium]
MDRIHRMSRGRKALLSLLLVGTVGTVAGMGTFSAFSDTTTNTGNVFDAGTVAISDNDLNSAMYNVTDAAPGTNVQACIQVTYTGSLDSTVSLYGSPVGAIGQYVDLTIEKGTGSGAFPDCTGFTPQGGAVYAGTLGDFASTRTDFASGVAVNPGAQAAWLQDDVLVYRFTLTLQDDDSAIGLQSGPHSFTWEAQNV